VKIVKCGEDVRKSVEKVVFVVGVSAIFPVDVKEICPKVLYVSV